MAVRSSALNLLAEKIRGLQRPGAQLRFLLLGGMWGQAIETRCFEVDGVHVTHVGALKEVDTSSAFDVVIAATHNNPGDEAFIWDLRQKYPDALLGASTWDNHHHYTQNLRIVLGADLVFPSQWAHHRYLASMGSVVGPHLPLSTHQFTGRMIDRLFPAGLSHERNSALYGGFFAWNIAGARSAFVEAIRRDIPGNAVTLRSDPEAFGAESIEQRLAEWCSYKVGLVVPINGHLSSRLFECLLTGQVPLLPRQVPDLDAVIPPALQAELPIIRFDDDSPQSVRDAWQQALERFDQAGAEGIERRHRYARANHEIDSRIRRVGEFITRFKQIEVRDDGGSIRTYAAEG